MIGGTGLLGYFVSRELVERGHQVTAVGLEAPAPDTMPKGVAVVVQNLETLSRSEMVRLLGDADAVIHGAGADGRFSSRPPALEAFRRSNVDPFFGLIAAMQEVGSRRLVILGSYYTALARLQPELPIMTRSAYPISRAEQANLVFSLAGTSIAVAILELPFIFGAAPGRGTLWGHLIDRLLNSEGPIRVPSGGTACITTGQVAQATAAAIDCANGHAAFPIGGENLTHRQIYEHFAAALGIERQIIPLTPDEALSAAMAQMHQLADAGMETGYHPLDLAALQSANLFLDPAPAMAQLGYQRDDVATAIAETVRATLQFGGAGPGSVSID